MNKMTRRTKNTTLKAILDVILYENPSTQDEIAEKLGLTRRYVTKLLQPLVKEGVVRRAYILDIKKFEKFSDMFMEDVKTSREHAGTFYIKEILRDMSSHVCKQLELSYQALILYDSEMADEALQMDYVTNKMLERVRSSVDTAMAMNPYSEFGKTTAFSEIAYDLERIADHSCHLANFTRREAYQVDPDIVRYLDEMYEIARKMVKCSMRAFLNEDLHLKDKVMAYEDKMHHLQKKAMNFIAIQMAETPFEDKERSTYYLSLSRVVKAFERIGDISLEIIDTSGEFYQNIPRSTTPEQFKRR